MNIVCQNIRIHLRKNEIVFGLREKDKPPTLISPRPRIRVKRFKTINEINSDFQMSKSQISNDFFGRIKKISDLKTMLRRAIKNLKSTENVTLTSQNIEDIKQLVKNGVARFNTEKNKFTDNKPRNRCLPF